MRLYLRALLIGAIVGLSSLRVAFALDPGGGPPYGPYWKVTITSAGTVTSSISGSFAWGTPSANYIAACAMTVSNGNSHSVSTSGSYHIKAQWVNYDGTPALNPAKTLIVKTTSSASWHGTAGKSSGGSSNGLGTPEVTAPGSGSSSGDKYEAKDSSSGLVEYDVPVSASVSAQGFTQAYGYGVSVGVSASVYPVTVYLIGSIPQNGIENALIGQGVTGNLNTPPFAASAQSGHSWLVGGDTFQNWTVTADQSKATLVTGPVR